MNEKMFQSGIIATLIVAVWDKVKAAIWSVCSLFICYYEFKSSFIKYGATYVWDKLGRTTSLSPIYLAVHLGSSSESKMFIREIGFNNFRLVFFGRIPTFVKLDNNNHTHVYGLKPFINAEKIMLTTLEHFKVMYHNNEVLRLSTSRFFSEYIRGSLGEGHEPERLKSNKSDSPEVARDHDGMDFVALEQYNIGRRVNYTSEEIQRYLSCTTGDTKLLDNIYLSESLRDLKNKLELWFKNKEWFKARSIQWKRGVLLHGEPGTGKTSIITALGEYFNVPVFIYDLSTFTNEDLQYKWYGLSCNSPCFVVFEDLDSVFKGRVNIANTATMNVRPLSFDCVLNTLDGAVKYDGIVTFITTNNINDIDPALGGGGNTRPGRIDYVYNTGDISEDGKYFIANRVFVDMDSKEELIIKASNEFKGNTPAQFKEFCINLALESYNKTF